MKVAVITPTVDSAHLPKCLSSVAEQTYDDIVHYVVIDGSEYRDAQEKIAKYQHTRIITLEEKIGRAHV